MFQKSHKFNNTLLVFINKMLLKFVTESRFTQIMCKRRTRVL